MAKITINGISLDPAAQAPALTKSILNKDDITESSYILVQANAPLDKDQKQQLAAKGAQILEYVPENTYLCGYSLDDLTAIRALPFVAWANVYLRGFKVAAPLRAPMGGVRVKNLLALGPIEASVTKEPRDVEVVLHRDVSMDAVREKLAAAAGVDTTGLQVSSGKLRVRVAADRLDRIAALDEVRHIEEFVQPKLFNSVALGIMRTDVVHDSLLEGKGQVVAVCDTGFDKGSLTDVHPAFVNRVKKLYALGRSTASDPNGHGTHVAGSVLGDGHSATMGGAIRGSAPKATLVLQSVLDGSGRLGGLPDDLNDLFHTPYDADKARVHTNSWGSDVDGAYTQSSFEVDDFVWRNRDCVILFAAGNAGTDRDASGVIDQGSVGSPGTAKNCITVGASESLREDTMLYGDGWPSDYPAEPIASDAVADNPEGMAAFSSRGPTADGRVKPDLVAPGTSILSARSRHAAGNSGWGASTDSLYMFEGGTSMATPLVAGCAAVVREFLMKSKADSPSAALVKAMLINGAKNLEGQYLPTEANGIPNLSEGFGRVDLAATVGPFGGGAVQWWEEGEQLDTGDEHTIELDLATPASLVKVTLVWTDPAGETLQNDLDLVVKLTGREQHGNMAPKATGFDRRNNVEQVSLEDVPAGRVTIVVRAHRIALHPQPFAVVARIAK